jgi:CHASE2 domain-containing sensor protein
VTPKLAIGRLLIGVVAVLVAATAWMSGVLDTPEHATIDARFALRDTPAVTDMAVISIDDASIAELKTWPFRRKFHAQAVDALRRAHARAIVYDVQFTEPSPHPQDDLALYDAIGRAGGAVLATSTSDEQGHTDVLGGDELLRKIDSRAGAANFPASWGGVIRRYPQRVGRLESLAVVTAERVTGRPPKEFRDGRAWIDFRGGPNTFPTYSFTDLLHGRVPPGALNGRIVVVGASAASLQDRHVTATSGDDTMSGPEVQANAIWTAVHGNPLRDAPTWATLAVIALLGLLVPALSLWLRPLVTLGTSVVLAIATAGAAYVAFGAGIVAAVTAPLLALGLGTAGTFVAGYAVEWRRRRRAAAYGRTLEREVAERTQEVRMTQLEILQRLSQAAEHRDNETGAHLRRMSLLCGRLARATGMSEPDAERIEQASLLHDLGKIGLPDDILHKPGKLTPEERTVMQRHTTIGAQLLAGSSSPLLQAAEEIARTHHERWDGGGYPAGLRGEDIPLPGRIAAICDVYDALLSERPYKQAWTVEAALGHLEAQSGAHFDPALVDAFVALMRARLSAPPDELPRAA